MSLFRAVWAFIVAKPIEDITQVLKTDQALDCQTCVEEPYLMLNSDCSNEYDVISSALFLTSKQKRNILTKSCNQGQCINVAMNVAEFFWGKETFTTKYM